MAIRSTSLVCLILAGLAACDAQHRELLLVRPASPVDADIAEEVIELLGKDSNVSIRMIGEGRSDEAALEALATGEADLALVSNNLPYRTGIATVMPMYPSVLHIGYIGERQFSSENDLFRSANVFAGPEGSASRMMFETYLSRNDFDHDQFIYVDSPQAPFDVFVVFAPISPDRLDEYPDFKLVSAGSADDIGKGTGVDAAVLLNPQLRPFVIPARTYGEATPAPVLTVAVDMLLVARNGLSEPLIYDLVRELHRLRPALASLRPGLFRTDYGSYSTNNSTFLLHPGLIAYLNRNEPSVYERYSGIAEVVVTVIVALFSAGFAGVRIFRMRRKNRIDTFYTDVIAIRHSVTESSSADERLAAIRKIRELQDTAFDLLVDEKLSADESFRIFVSLSNDALRDLELAGRASGPGS
ncbi:MAG: TAXI family TRAP transporter solute-binding subunit [Woeseiaceae bacterium]|nr:TAXI family TRAP transporter solute-binding subunit [Woeseiaceae bacterium]